MSEAFASGATPRHQKPTVLAAAVASQQWGVIGWRQLQRCSVSKSTARRWRADGKLHVIHRGVYALGHASVPAEGRLVAALLHAGDSAVLSHATAAWWWGLIADEPATIDVSTQTCARSLAGLVVHQRRRLLDQTRHRRFPLTTVPQTLLDLAATTPLSQVRRALAEADYRRLLDPRAIEAVLGQGRPGSAKLRRALARHQPRLAQIRSPLEGAFLERCESGIAVPEVNVRIEGWTVDALWRREGVVVELDGYGNHRSRAQTDRDRHKELCLRRAGFVVIRYSEDQVREEPQSVLTDLSMTLEQRRATLEQRRA